jgi:hypothetical protein
MEWGGKTSKATLVYSDTYESHLHFNNKDKYRNDEILILFLRLVS